jgi:hypothetical protein
LTPAKRELPPPHLCGLCKTQVYSAIHEKSGLRLHIEVAAAGDLAIVQNLPGMRPADGLPRVIRVIGPTGWRVHRCSHPTAPSFSAANFNRKRRPEA